MSEFLDDEQHRRLTEPHRSKSAKIAWKRHRSSYNKANRNKERDYMNKSFYSVAKELEESINQISEAQVVKDNVFNLEFQINFTNISGGVSFHIDKDSNNVSFSSVLTEDSRGNYALQTDADIDLDSLYTNIKDDMQSIANSFDNEINQLLNKYGLKEV